MGLLTYIIDANIRDSTATMIGEVLSMPALVKGDGAELTYAVDVRIVTDDEGYVRYVTDEEAAESDGKLRANDPVLNRVETEVLRNVPLASGVRELVYAQPGSPVTLARTPGGKFEVVGFSKRKPGTHTIVPVDLDTLVPGTPQSVGYRVHRLTYEELADPRFGNGYGTVPYGAFAIMQGDTVIEVRF